MLRTFLQKIFPLAALTGQQVEQMVFVFLMQGFALVMALAISLLITNLLGAASYGIYSYGFSWVNLLAVFSCMGFEQLALKEVPAYSSRHRGDFIRGLFQYSFRMVLMVSALTALVIFLLSWWRQLPADGAMRTGLWLALLVLPVIAVLNLRLAWLRSFHFNIRSQLPDKVIRPALFLMMFFIAWWIMQQSLNISMVIILACISITVALVVGNIFVAGKVMPVVAGFTPAYERLRWSKVAFSLLVVNGIYYYLSQLQIIALGTLSGARETGIFAIAWRLSDLEGYMLFAMNVVLAPLISKLFAENDKEGLQRLITHSLRLGFVFSLPVIVCFLFFPTFFLHFFGDEFGAGTFALTVLTLSQIVNFATGSVGYLLTMTGNERTAIRILFLCALLTTILSIILIPDFGVNGAATAAAVNNVLLNVLMAIAVRRKTGINATLINFR